MKVIEPYLIAKKTQALVALELRKRIWRCGKGGTGHPLPREEFEVRERLNRILRLLKKRV